jgi:catalase
MQQAVQQGRTPYLPNAVGGGCPFLAPDEDGGYVHVPRAVKGTKVRDRGPDDEYAQATLFWESMTEIEQDHLVDAFTFELGKVDVQAVVERMLQRLVLVNGELATRVGMGLGIVVDAARNASTYGDESPALRAQSPGPVTARPS